MSMVVRLLFGLLVGLVLEAVTPSCCCVADAADVCRCGPACKCSPPCQCGNGIGAMTHVKTSGVNWVSHSQAEKSDKVLILITNPQRCLPCRQLEVTLGNPSASVELLDYACVKLEEGSALAALYKYDGQKIPTLLIYKSGKLQKSHEGYLDVNGLKMFLQYP